MKSFLLYITLLLLPVFVIGQVSEHFSLEWDGIKTLKTVKDIEVNYLSFKGATNIPEFGSIPVFQKQIELPGNYFEIEPEVKILSTDTLHSNDYLGLSGVDIAPSTLPIGSIKRLT